MQVAEGFLCYCSSPGARIGCRETPERTNHGDQIDPQVRSSVTRKICEGLLSMEEFTISGPGALQIIVIIMDYYYCYYYKDRQ